MPSASLLVTPFHLLSLPCCCFPPTPPTVQFHHWLPSAKSPAAADSNLTKDKVHEVHRGTGGKG